MKETILKTQAITKYYTQKPAVDNISMAINKGDIYGLIGRNGAGKTTLIRIITSLILADKGKIELFGETSASKINEARRRMGCVVEMPALYPNLTAEQNLEYYRILRGIPDKKVIKETLQMVDLTDTGKKKFKNFSLGMKQRLGLALALLNNPDFIILDEPINGLDPVGISKMREIIKKLNTEMGITILISSHILTELSLVSNRYGIINEGRMIKELTNEELKEECQRGLSIIVDDTVKTASVLETELHTSKFKVINKNELRLYDYLDNPSEVTYRLVKEGVRVSALTEMGDNLEDYFLKQIKEGR